MDITPIEGFTAEASLSLSTDGPIPSEAWAAARAYDAAHPLKPAPSAREALMQIGDVRPSRRLALALMRQTILDCAPKGAIERADFERLAIPGDMIDALKNEAFRAAAAVEPRLLSLLAA
jgi:hypothetical protein